MARFPMDLEDLRMILEKVQFRNWRFVAYPLGPSYLLQAKFPGNTSEFGAPEAVELVHGRKWYVSPYATESEVVQTALKAVLTALEHEAREEFQFRGRAIFGPHFHVDFLHQLADSGLALDIRPPMDRERRTAP